jgi:hypothetical protein
MKMAPTFCTLRAAARHCDAGTLGVLRLLREDYAAGGTTWRRTIWGMAGAGIENSAAPNTSKRADVGCFRRPRCGQMLTSGALTRARVLRQLRVT